MIVTLNIKNKRDIEKLNSLPDIEIIETFDIEHIDKNDIDYKLYLEYKNKKNKNFIPLEDIIKEFK
ncbi:hypothetical protein [Nautilia sp.]